MLDEILRYLRNWFDVSRVFGEFRVQEGRLTLPQLLPGQYYRVIGSVFNDGVHGPEDVLKDETFSGAVWLLAIPQEVLSIAQEAWEWQKKAKPAEYQSESFGGYSYTRATGRDGGTMTWRDNFGARLEGWKKI